VCRQKDCGTDGAGGEGAVVCWLVEKFEVRKWIQVAWGCCRVGWARVCDAPERTGKGWFPARVETVRKLALAWASCIPGSITSVTPWEEEIKVRFLLLLYPDSQTLRKFAPGIIGPYLNYVAAEDNPLEARLGLMSRSPSDHRALQSLRGGEGACTRWDLAIT
jgi:hypothetical protein